MMPPPSRSAASMGLFSEIRLKINRENIVTYQGNVDQITGQIGALPPISALLSLFGRTHVRRGAMRLTGSDHLRFGSLEIACDTSSAPTAGREHGCTQDCL